MWEMHDKEFESVTALPPAERYSYTIKRVADWETLWSLAEKGQWALSGDDKGRELVPVWPHERFARACATGGWGGHEPQQIELPIWMERWIPGLQQENRLISVFPVFSERGRGAVVPPDQFREDLEAELELYE